MSFLQKIITKVPKHSYSQHALAEIMSENEQERKLIDKIYSASAINNRFTVIEDFPNFYKKNRETLIGDRMEVYKKSGLSLVSEVLYELNEDFSSFTHLITVSCTGLSAPGFDFKIIEKFGLNRKIERLNINFMGCFASFWALKQADTICKSYAGAKVLIISLELCTLHVQDQDMLHKIVSNALFSDGCAAIVVSNEESDGLKIKSFTQDVIPDSENEMSWNLGEQRFEMFLDNDVPNSISDYLKDFFKINPVDSFHHAVHPGGRKILDKYLEINDLDKENLNYSYEILSNFGNMSSATIIFILEKWMATERNKPLLAWGFGPGLTVEQMIFE